MVDGDLEDNISGYNKASQFLTTQERTLPFAGTLTASGLSDAYTGLYKPDEPFSCDTPQNQGQQTAAKVDYKIPLSSITSEFAKAFGTPKDTFQKVPAPAAAQVDVDSVVSYTTVAATQVQVVDPACGFDSSGHPLGATHVIEFRHYANGISDTLHREWDDNVEKLIHCNPM